MSFIFKMKVLRTSMTSRKTVPCLNVYLPSCSDTLQAPKICAVVHTSLLYKVHIVSVVILHHLRLAGDGSVSYVEAKSLSVSSAEEFLSEMEPSIMRPRNLIGLE